MLRWHSRGVSQPSPATTPVVKGSGGQSRESSKRTMPCRACAVRDARPAETPEAATRDSGSPVNAGMSKNAAPRPALALSMSISLSRPLS
jgi:hypothetical protein